MKAYVVTTGSIFGLITVLHILRMFVEPEQGRDPVYILLTLLAASVCIWAFWLLRVSPRP